MKREKLTAEPRTITGKQVKRLRQEGILPANVFGKNFTSLTIQVDTKNFEDVYQKAGETGLVDLSIEKDTHPVLIQNVQQHPITKNLIHVDFYKVNLKEKVKTTVPVVAVGEAQAVKEKVGALLQPLNDIEIEALPAELPEHIEVNVESLSAIDDQITVKDLIVPSGVTIIAEPDVTVFRIGELVSKEAEELEAQEEADAEAAKEEGDKEETAQKAEGTDSQPEDQSASEEPQQE